MKYRAKRDFLGVTKGREFSINAYGNISLEIIYNATIPNQDGGYGVKRGVVIDPTQYPDDFELVEEPKYTDRDLDSICDLFHKYWIMEGSASEEAVKQAIAELKQSKE